MTASGLWRPVGDVGYLDVKSMSGTVSVAITT
jgi:hypothetical protein